VIVDEADLFMLENPLKFAELINGCFCICFTATPDNCDIKGAERKAVDLLGFKRFNYVLDRAANVAKLEVDETLSFTTTEEKGQYIIELAKIGPVLVYCPTDLAEYLNSVVAADLIINVTPAIEYGALRKLD
jgi:hypothetical protein